jgi:hypothetical protein
MIPDNSAMPLAIGLVLSLLLLLSGALLGCWLGERSTVRGGHDHRHDSGCHHGYACAYHGFYFLNGIVAL